MTGTAPQEEKGKGSHSTTNAANKTAASTDKNDDNNNTISNKTTPTLSSSTNNISMLVTGFGPFQDIPINPTTILVHELPTYLQTSSEEWKQKLATIVTDWIVMDTSVQGVCETMGGFMANRTTTTNTTTKNKNNTPFIVLHLGVHYMAKGFHIEQCAYNDASFRIPDQCGYQPQQQLIVQSQPLGQDTKTQFNVEALVQSQMQQFPNVSTILSTNPGRFVCNYTYCYSMNYHTPASEEEEQHQISCLFLHVPKFEVVPKEIQLEYVSYLMQQLIQQVLPKN